MDAKNEDLVVIKKKDGTNYTIRRDRDRYFFPDEWKKFIAKVTRKKHNILFKTLLHTGGRAMEVLNLRAVDFNFDRKMVSFKVVKNRVAKKSYSLGKKREFLISKKFVSELKSYIVKNNISKNDYLFLNNKKLPENYFSLTNKEKSKYYTSVKVSSGLILKRKLKAAGIEDYHNFSLHNIRKTYAMWMKVYNPPLEEVCKRMGHDIPTHMEHYSSPVIFNPIEKRAILNICGHDLPWN